MILPRRQRAWLFTDLSNAHPSDAHLFCARLLSAPFGVSFLRLFFCVFGHSLRRASMGFRLAACMEGRMPKMMPISMEKATPRMMVGILM